MKKIIVVSIISTILVILSFYAVNSAIVQQQKSKQREIANTLLQYSENLSLSVASTLKSMTTQGCDKESIDNYRKVKLDSLYFSDIGFVQKGKILCTAFWGKLTTPILLPNELHRTPNGFTLVQFSQKKFFTGNAAIYNNIIIFTSRYAYDKFIPVTASYSLNSTTKDFRRTFFTASPSSENRSWLSSKLFTLTITKCSSTWDLCVTVKHNDAGLASLSVVVFILLGAVLYFIWFSLLLFTIRLYEDRFSLERTLVKAVKANAFEVNYQPIIRTYDQKITGVEVLSRWRDTNHMHISPEFFIPLIEKLGLYDEYYTHIMRKAFSEISSLITEHQLLISLNVGRTEIEDKTFSKVLHRECLLNNIPLSLIKIELSEKAVASEGILEEFCKELKSIGVKISIDDFGVQNSNISRLAKLEYDEIKIDKSLVDGISENYKQDIFIIFCDALMKLNKTLVFEGVEDHIQYDFIASRYPHSLIQGWYFSKSLSKNELNNILSPRQR